MIRIEQQLAFAYRIRVDEYAPNLLPCAADCMSTMFHELRAHVAAHMWLDRSHSPDKCPDFTRPSNAYRLPLLTTAMAYDPEEQITRVNYGQFREQI